MKNKNEMMKLAVQKARSTMEKDMGGPFGAAVVMGDEILSVCGNTVLSSHDPTAHAEINAIREASRRLGTHDLGGCVLFATGFPCPMCLSAILWANIDTVYYGCNLGDAAEIGFRDDFIYEYIKKPTEDGPLRLASLDREACLSLYEEYARAQKQMY